MALFFGDVRSLNLITISALLTHGFLYYISIFCIALPWLSYSVPGLTNIIILTWTTAVSIYSYLFCVLADPGKVPDGWQPDQEASAVKEVKKKDGGARFCSKCSVRSCSTARPDLTCTWGPPGHGLTVFLAYASGLQTSKKPPLSCVPEVCFENGPPLPLHVKLRRTRQL
jgi:hypothetical protein